MFAIDRVFLGFSENLAPGDFDASGKCEILKKCLEFFKIFRNYLGFYGILRNDCDFWGIFVNGQDFTGFAEFFSIIDNF